MTRSLKNGGAAYVVGTIASGDRFVADREAMKNICEQFGAVGVEMESGAVAQICTAAGVPFAVLRCVSDGGDSVRDYYEFSRLACERFTAAVLDFLRET
jgi:adenosylhomocysteine nucleosidase